MKIQAEVSIYPLRKDDLASPIRQFVDGLENNGLQIKIGPMSSLISGESQLLFESLGEQFRRLAEKYDVVLTAKISNACSRT